MSKNVQLIQGGCQSPSSYETRYGCLNGGAITLVETESRIAGIVAADGVIRNLKVYVSAAPGTGKSWDITILKNGSPTDITVNIADSATTGEYTGEISVSAGDTLSIKTVPTSSPAQPNGLNWNTEFISENNETLLMSAHNNGTATDELYCAVIGDVDSVSNETYTEFLIPCSGTIKNLYVKANLASGTGKTHTFVVRKNGSNQTLTTTISGASQVTNSDLSNTFSVAAGDVITIYRSGDVNNDRYNNFGLVFSPDTVGNFILGCVNGKNLLNVAKVIYQSPNIAGTAWTTNENNKKQISSEFTIKNIYVKLSGTPSATQTFTLRQNGSASALAVSLTTGDSTGTASADVSISNNDYIDTHKNSSSQELYYAISYTGYRVDISTEQKTILSDITYKRTEQESILSDIKFILAREQKSLLSDTIYKAIKQNSIYSDIKYKVLNNQKSILSDIQYSHSIQASILSNTVYKQVNIQKSILSDIIYKQINLQSSINSDINYIQRVQESILSDIKYTVVYNGKFIHNTDLFIVTDSSPAQLIKADITNPASYTKHTITGCINGKDLCINHDREYLYVSLNNGYVAKISLVDPSIQTLTYVGENKQLYSISHNPDYLTTFIADGIADDSLFILDEATYAKINSDIRTRIDATSIIKTWFKTFMGGKINSDIRTRIDASSNLKSDIRFLNEAYNNISLLSMTDFHVYVDAVQLGNDDLRLDSIRITKTADNKSTASFILARKHDNLDTPVEITKNNVVTIYMGTKIEFTGRINNLNAPSEAEYVEIYCESDTIPETYNIVEKTLPMTVLNTQIHPFDILINDVKIENPYLNGNQVIIGNNNKYWTGSGWTIKLSEALTFATFALAQTYIETRIKNYIEARNPNAATILKSSHIYSYIDFDRFLGDNISIDDTFLKKFPIVSNYEQNTNYYKGIKVDLGTKITQQVEQWYHVGGSVHSDIEDGSFEFTPGYTYFWTVDVTLFQLEGPEYAVHNKYIGTSLSSLSTDMYEIFWANYNFQKINKDKEEALGYYTLGQEPFKEISVKNGKLIAHSKWEDRDDGFYSTCDESYDYENYAKTVAAIEYEKIKNINGNVLPKTSTNISLTIDGYMYYNLDLLTKINIDNTTTAGIYKNLNGFPVSIKQIDISSADMSVSLSCDNIKSSWELDRLTESYPEEPGPKKAWEYSVWPKFDLQNWEEVDSDEE